MIVIDASVLTDFLLGRPQALAAVQTALGDREHESLHAPELIEAETLNALRRLVLSGSVSDRRAGDAVADLADVRLARYPHAPLRERVWQLRHNLTAYDASYLALAEALEDPLLVTADAALAGVASKTLGTAGVLRVQQQ